MEGKIRVLVVDDSPFMQRQITRILEGSGFFRVVACAADGERALSAAIEANPDVITMDINMPRMDGLSAVGFIMANAPKPIVIVSSYSRQGGKSALYAMELGAIEIVEKPSGTGVTLDLGEKSRELVEKVRLASRIRVVRNAAVRPGQSPRRDDRPDAGKETEDARSLPAKAFDRRLQLVAIASSTGGPSALAEVLPLLPAGLEACILVAQHMPAGFTADLADQLDHRCKIRVREGRAGDTVREGMVFIAPGDRHLEIDGCGRLVVHDGSRLKGPRPSADMLLGSAAKYGGPRTMAMILTGMGGDGSEGVRHVKDGGGHVVAQDEETSVVYGMPAEAVKTGCVDRVLPVGAMAEEVLAWILGTSRGRMAARSPGLAAEKVRGA